MPHCWRSLTSPVRVSGRLPMSLDADARTAVGTVEVWAPKDHFVHLAVWAAYQARRLEALATGKPPTQPADNDTVFLEHRDDPWETIWADLMQALDDNAAAVMRASDEELTALNPERAFTLFLDPEQHLSASHRASGATV